MSPPSQPQGLIVRDGDLLRVPPNVHFSERCYLCGATAVGPPIAMHLHVSNAYRRRVRSIAAADWLFLLDVIAYLVFLVVFIIDLPASRRRRAWFGLCARHRARRRLWRWAAGLAAIGGFALAVASLVFPFAEGPGAAAFFSGLGLMALAAVFSGVPTGPQLAAVTPEAFWLLGAGGGFAEAYPRTGSPPPR